MEKDKNEIGRFTFDSPEDKDRTILSVIEPYFASYIEKYL